MQRNDELMAAYSAGELAMEDYMAFSPEPMAGRTPEEIDHLVGPWVEDVIEPIIYSDACTCIAKHRAKGDRILVISASGVHWSSRLPNASGSTKCWVSSWTCSMASTAVPPSAC